MSKNENVKIWRRARKKYWEVMDRNALCYWIFENPPDEDLVLADRLREQMNLAEAKMKEFRRKPD